jgi:hypothetical protein
MIDNPLDPRSITADVPAGRRGPDRPGCLTFAHTGVALGLLGVVVLGALIGRAVREVREAALRMEST